MGATTIRLANVSPPLGEGSCKGVNKSDILISLKMMAN